MNKTCTLCKEELPQEAFAKRKGKYLQRCQLCLSDQQVIWSARRKNRAMAQLLNWPAPLIEKQR